MPRQKEGSVIKRKDRPGLWARLAYVDDAGHQRVIQRKVANKTEGQLLLKKLIREIEDHGAKTIDGDRVTFKQLAEYYAERKLTAPVYKGDARISGLRSHHIQKVYLRALVESFGARRIKTITHADVEKYKLDRHTQPTARGTERAVASVNRELQLLRALFNFARRNGWLTRSPFEMGEPLISQAQENRRDRVLSREEEKRLLVVCTEKRAHLRPILICALDTAMRRGEILQLRWSDVDFEASALRVRKATTKDWEDRTVPMSSRLREELNRLLAVAPPDPDGLVFGIKDNFKRSLQTACKLAGIEGFHFHDTRHTATTRLAQSGKISPLELMRITGHSQLETLARYFNQTEEQIQKAVSVLDEWHACGRVEPERPELIN